MILQIKADMLVLLSYDWQSLSHVVPKSFVPLENFQSGVFFASRLRMYDQNYYQRFRKSLVLRFYDPASKLIGVEVM